MCKTTLIALSNYRHYRGIALHKALKQKNYLIPWHFYPFPECLLLSGQPLAAAAYL